LKTISTLRGTFRKMSKTERSNPSFVMTAFRSASTSCSVCGTCSSMLEARLKVDVLSFPGRGSSGASPMLARPDKRVNSCWERCHVAPTSQCRFEYGILECDEYPARSLNTTWTDLFRVDVSYQLSIFSSIGIVFWAGGCYQSQPELTIVDTKGPV